MAIQKKVEVIDEEGAAAVRLIFEWYASGMTIHEIANELNARNLRTNRGELWQPKDE